MKNFDPLRLQNYSSESIIEDIKRVYLQYFNPGRMTKREFVSRSRVSASTINKFFGTWNLALQEANIDFTSIIIERKKVIPIEEIKSDIKRVIDLNHNEYFTYKFYKENEGKFSFQTILSRFNRSKWNDFLFNDFNLFIIRNVIKDIIIVTPISEEQLLTELKNVWDEFGRRPTYNEFRISSKISIKIFEGQFGTWTAAIEAFCLRYENYSSSSKGKKYNTTKTLLIQELNLMKITHKLKYLEQNEYKMKGGKYSVPTFHKHFGSWKNALHEVGLKSGREAPTVYELFEDLQTVWELLGRQPYHNEMKLHGKYSCKFYTKKYGTWTKAIYAFVDDRQLEETEVGLTEIEVISKDSLPPDSIRGERIIGRGGINMRTPRTPSPRLRFKVLRRDNFTCTYCGSNSNNNPSFRLHVDHKIPYKKGGETVLENLQVSCETCNLGKSDIEL